MTELYLAGMALLGAFIAALGVSQFRIKRNLFTFALLINCIWVALMLIARATVNLWALWFS